MILLRVEPRRRHDSLELKESARIPGSMPRKPWPQHEPSDRPAACTSSRAPCATSFAAIVDFTTWTPVADPADPNFTSSATVSSASIQVANGSIPVGTDIGFQSVDGVTLGSSTSGSYFDPSNNFTIAIDYNLDFGAGAQGFLGLGFGIGEDGDGMNSAGVGMATFNGAPFLSFGGAARINDQDQSPLLLSLSSTLTGSLFVQYDASSGDVTVGAASTQGARRRRRAIPLSVFKSSGTARAC